MTCNYLAGCAPIEACGVIINDLRYPKSNGSGVEHALASRQEPIFNPDIKAFGEIPDDRR